MPSKFLIYGNIFPSVVAVFVKSKTVDARHFVQLSVVCFYICNDRVI